jgi:ABC-type multidrug transport system fused ATPase/permease subunit
MTLALTLAQAAAEGASAEGVAVVANNFQAALQAFKSGGWIVALIGAAAMVGRLLVDEADDASWQRSLRHVLAAAIFAVIAYFLMFQWELSSLNKAIIQGLCGAVAPELVDWITSSIRRRLGFKHKQNKPAWKKLFTRQKKPARRRRSAAKQPNPAPPKRLRKGLRQPVGAKPPAKKSSSRALAQVTSPKKPKAKPVTRKAPTKSAASKPVVPKPTSSKPAEGQEPLNL